MLEVFTCIRFLYQYSRCKEKLKSYVGYNFIVKCSDLSIVSYQNANIVVGNISLVLLVNKNTVLLN